MYKKHFHSVKPLLRLITLLVVECFVVSSIAPDYDIKSSITEIRKYDYSDEPIGSLVGYEEVATRQLYFES